MDKAMHLPQGVIHYGDIGAGEPPVFLHGIVVHGGLWRGVVQELAGRFRCVVPGLPFGSHIEPTRPEADLTPPGFDWIASSHTRPGSRNHWNHGVS